ncbi:MAG: DUF1501 domain-containing protein [Chthoniobacteraceae bacterium]
MSSEQYPNLTSRRDFIRQASCAAVGTLAIKSTIRDLRLINAAMAQTGLGGYKALVCLFLGGGNDANNWIVPTDAPTFAEYTANRGIVALPELSLRPLYQAGTSGSLYTDADGHSYGFHPSCAELQTLFGEDKIAPILNIGTLVRPTTKAQYNANPNFYRPPQLFSHSDQVTQWQTSIPDQPPLTGWGGRVADLLNATANPNGSISMSVSLNGANIFEAGNLVSQYHVATTGAVTMSGNLMTGTGARVTALKDILGLSHTNLQRTAYADVVDNAIYAGNLLNTAIAPTVLDTYWTVPFPNTTLGNQLKMIARIIQARGDATTLPPPANKFNMARQVFFCSVGGYDTHTQQVAVNGTDQPAHPAGAHYRLLAEVSTCMFAFQRAMEQLGVSNNVTTFTASDFSRTFFSNGQGTDHSWGAHSLVMGGAVNGGVTYGKLPNFAINGPDGIGNGAWIPTTAVDQHSATLAKWFGVDPGAKMASVFPNLSRFATPDLLFMKPA